MNKTPEYRIDVKIRNNLILEKMEEVGIKNVAELARLSGVSQASVSRLLNLKQSPFTTASSKTHKEPWIECVKKIAKTLQCFPEELFPEEPIVLRKNTAEVKLRAETVWGLLEYRKESTRAMLPETISAAGELRQKLNDAIATLMPREQIVLNARFFEDKTLEELGERFGVSRQMIRIIEAKALQKLRLRSKSHALLEAGAMDGEVLTALSHHADANVD